MDRSRSTSNFLVIFYSLIVEAMGQKHVDALDHSIWLEAEEVMKKNWGIWCQRISMEEELRGCFTYALSGAETQDIGDECKTILSQCVSDVRK